MYPTDRHYSKDHEWISVDGDSATMGITQYAQDQLGDIVFVELSEVDKRIQKGDVIGTIESVKAVSEIYAPLSGTVTEINTMLDDKPETVNGDPHGVGWFCKIKLADTGELDELMEAAAYQSFVDSQ
jgi:glycine cleavage system H protein